MTNVSRLRASVRAAKLPDSDKAGVELATMLASLLDRINPRTLRQIANGERDLTLEDKLELVRICGPQYLRTLTALGLTRAGRGATPASSIPTVGSPAGATGDLASHDAHRQRFSERRTG